uniref:Transmembrane protein n=1 Tax=Davidia involucrata TaxID=16924 RepID=A0A5B7BUK0_DAVIN
MSLASQNLLINSNSRISFYFSNTHVTALKNPNFSLSLPSKYFTSPPHFQILRAKSSNPNNFTSSRTHHWPLRAYESDGTVQQPGGIDNLNFDAFLAIAEFLCLASSAFISIGLAVNSAVSSSQKPVFVWLGNRVLVWQFVLVLLVGAVAIGASIRRRQWNRICKDFSKPGSSGVNLVGRIEKLEEDLRSSATIIRVLSRQLEKLGIRFRVTRKALKEPIAETAALAQKNSEATRALAVQEDILEKELGEIQKVLLAMQEQQQKQLELILAIGKSGKLWESRRGPSQEEEAVRRRNSAEKGVKQIEINQIQALAGQKEASSD